MKLESDFEEIKAISVDDIICNREVKFDSADQHEWRSKYQNDAGLFTAVNRPLVVEAMYNQCDSIPSVHLWQVRFFGEVQ